MRSPTGTSAFPRCAAAAAAVVLVALILTPAAGAQAPPAADEVRRGQIYARQLEARYKVLTDPALVERVTRVGADVAASSDRTELPYTFKILDQEIPNAVSLPGGFVYVTKGLLSFVRSDHELAAVLAHEVAHAAHRHQMELIRRGNEAAFWTLVVAVLSRDAAVAAGAQLLGISLLSGYTREMERDADLSAIGYLQHTPYTPVGVLTVMERLAREEQLRPQPDPGAFRDHPRTEERVAYVEAELRRRGIPVVRRVAAAYLRLATRTVTEGDRPVGEVLVNETVILRLPDPSRVAVIAERLDRFFNTDPDPWQVATLRFGDTWEIVGGRGVLITVTRADAGFWGMPLDAAAREVQARLQWIIRQDLRMRQFQG